MPIIESLLRYWSELRQFFPVPPVVGPPAAAGDHVDVDPYAEGCPPEILEQQAEQYRELFELFRRHADVIERVSFWNLHDDQSWLNYFPWRRTNHPLLFDREGQPKPAFEAVLEALADEAAE